MPRGSISSQLNRFNAHKSTRLSQREEFRGFDTYGDRRRYSDRKIESVRDVFASLILNFYELIRCILVFLGDMVKHIYQITYGFFQVVYGEVTGNGYF